jgi:hypothetical protein
MTEWKRHIETFQWNARFAMDVPSLRIGDSFLGRKPPGSRALSNRHSMSKSCAMRKTSSLFHFLIMFSLCCFEVLKNRKSEGCFSSGKECATSQQGLTQLQEWKGEGDLLTLSRVDPSPLISPSQHAGFENVRIFARYPAGRTNKNRYRD